MRVSCLGCKRLSIGGTTRHVDLRRPVPALRTRVARARAKRNHLPDLLRRYAMARSRHRKAGSRKVKSLALGNIVSIQYVEALPWYDAVLRPYSLRYPTQEEAGSIDRTVAP